MKTTLSMLYQLQVLNDQLMSTDKKRDEHRQLCAQNESDFKRLEELLKRQSAALDEAVKLKQQVTREIYVLSQNIFDVRHKQGKVMSRIDYRLEVRLDRQLTNYQNALHVKFKELNQLLWQIGEPLRHPTFLKAALDGTDVPRDAQERATRAEREAASSEKSVLALMDMERELQMSFAGFPLPGVSDEELGPYLAGLCLRVADQLKRVGGVARYNQLLKLSEAECRSLTESAFDELTEEDQAVINAKHHTQEERRAARERVRYIEERFNASARSFTRLGEEPRPKDYEGLLRACAELELDDLRARLAPALPLSVEGDLPNSKAPVCPRFKADCTINPEGFVHFFQEKRDRLDDLRRRMDKVEALQMMEVRAEESKEQAKVDLQSALKAQLPPPLLRTFDRLAATRDRRAVAYIFERTFPAKDSKSFPTRESSCSACQVTIPASLRQRVRRFEELCRCPSCQRVLVPFGSVEFVKMEVDPLLVSEEERVAMEVRGEIEMIPACSNCKNELYANKETREALVPKEDLSSMCPHCSSYIVPLTLSLSAPPSATPGDAEAGDAAAVRGGA